MLEGARLWEATLEALEDQAWSAPSALPGWTRAHVVAHVALNTGALRNLVTWARTGTETPMYASPEARDGDIEGLSGHPVGELRERSAAGQRELEADLAELSDEQWAATVRVRQGTEITASTIPWLRAREVFLHALDLDSAATDVDLPVTFSHELVGEVARLRSHREGHPALVLREDGTDAVWEVGRSAAPAPVIVGDVRALAAWITGRPTTLGLATSDGLPPPDLPAWL